MVRRSVIRFLALALMGLTTLWAQESFGACGPLTVNQQPYDGYAYVGNPTNHDYQSVVTATGTQVGQILSWYWTRNGVQITGPNNGAGSYTVNSAGQYIINSVYTLTSASATTALAGDYRLVVSSNCPGFGTTLTQSAVAIMSVTPTINSAPTDLLRSLGGSGNFTVTASDGLGGSSLTYQWFREEGYNEIALASTTGTQSVTLSSLGLTGRYYVKVGHSNIGTDRPASEYGQTGEQSAYLVLNVPSQATLASQVCRVPHNSTLSPLQISPNTFNPTTMKYEVYEHATLSLDGADIVDSGIGNCNDASFSSFNGYICYDDNASRAADAQQYYISTTSSIIQTQYRYERNAVSLGNLSSLDSFNLDYYYDYDPTLLPANEEGVYRLKVTYLPCEGNLASPLLSNSFDIDIIAGSVTFPDEYSKVRNPNSGYYTGNLAGYESQQIDIPLQPTAIVKGGLSLRATAVASNGNSIQSLQWQKRANSQAQWANVPSNPNRYTGEDYSDELYFYHDDQYSQPSYDGLVFSDAGEYRLKVTDQSNNIYYSQTFIVDVKSQRPFEILGLPTNLPANPLPITAGNPLSLFPTVYPLDATSLNYSWQISPTGQNNWATISTASFVVFPFQVGVWDVRLTVQNTSNNQVTGQSATGGPISSTFTVAATNAPPPTVSIVTPPSSQTVNDYDQVAFSVLSNPATGVTYAWQRCDAGQPCAANSPSWTTIPGCTTAICQFQALYTMNGNQYRVTVTGNGSATSNAALLTVTPRAPVINSISTVPTNFTVSENGSASITANLSSTTTIPVTYQWQRKAPGGSSFVNFGAAVNTSQLSHTLNLSNLTFASDNGAQFRVNVINTASPTGILSAASTLTVTGAACSAPPASNLINPANGSSNVSLFPLLSWTPVSAQQGCGVTYNVRLGTNTTCSLNQIVGFGLVGTSLQIASALQPLTDYRWCVSSVVNGNPEVFSSTSQFTTTTATAEAPENLYTLPATTAESPAGNQQIILGAYNGEVGATGIFYLKRPQGDVEIGQILIGSSPSGQFEIAVDVTAFGTQSGAREYYARQRRQGSAELSPASLSVIYYYDSGMAGQLLPPALQKNGESLGALKWLPVGNFTASNNYRVYRRAGLEDVVQNDPRVKFQNKPYFLIETPAVFSNGWMTFQDPSVTANENGVSYFVTTVSNSLESPRSNAVSFGDLKGPKRSLAQDGGTGPYQQRVQFVSLLNGESAEGYLCNINSAGYFHQYNNAAITDYYENSPDMIALIQVKPRTPGVLCSNENYQLQSQAISRPVNALAPVTIPSQGINNCLPIGTLNNINLGEDICIKTCLMDNSGRFEDSNPLNAPNPNEPDCIESGSAFTFTAFDGVTAVTPQEDGTSVRVEWQPPQANGQSQQPLAYIVKASNAFNAEGSPIFNSNTDSRQIDASETQMVFDGLLTNTTYCFSVTAIDEDPLAQGGGAQSHLCTQTLNNKPVIQNLTITNDPNEVNMIKIDFQIIDRQSDGVSLTGLSFKNSEVSQWISVNDQSISGNSDFFATTAGSDSPQYSVVWNSLAYFSGHHPDLQLQLKFVDVQGNETMVETNATTAFFAGSRSASYARNSISGCTTIEMSDQSPLQNQRGGLIWLALMGLLVSAFIYLRRGLIQKVD